MSSARSLARLFFSRTSVPRTAPRTSSGIPRVSTRMPCPNTVRAAPLHTSASLRMADRIVDSETISDMTEKEKNLTGQATPVKGGPTAQAQRHVYEDLSDGRVVSDIARGEEAITHNDGPVAGGPAAAAQSQAAQASATSATNTVGTHSGTIDSQTISDINDAESHLTGQSAPVKGGPTAQAQKHAGEPISSQVLHDITQGEKSVAGDRVAGGPTSRAQSELAKSRQS